MAMFDSPKNILQQRLKETLNESVSSVVSDLIKLSLLKLAEKDEDLVIYSEVYKLLGPEKFSEMVSLLDGRSLDLPGKEDFKDIIITTLAYYYKTIENKNWDEIKALIGEPDLNTIKFGIRAQNLGTFLDTMMGRLNR